MQTSKMRTTIADKRRCVARQSVGVSIGRNAVSPHTDLPRMCLFPMLVFVQSTIHGPFSHLIGRRLILSYSRPRKINHPFFEVRVLEIIYLSL